MKILRDMNEPVLVIAFNRPEEFERLLARLREIQPKHVYVAVDGPREGHQTDFEGVCRTRDLVKSIDWQCNVKTLFREVNLGCGLGVSSAITWFFENVDRGIILEDDLVPDPSFFPFCTELLERYENDPRVFAISGCNYAPPSEQSSADAYRFSRVPHIWAWATWKRSWQKYQLDIGGWRNQLPTKKLWNAGGRSISGFTYWMTTFDLLARKQIDTWDGQLVFAAMRTDGLTATSNVNLVENLGFGESATHTKRTPRHLRQVEPIELPTTPIRVAVDERADAWTRRHHFEATLPGFVQQGTRYLKQLLRRNK